MSRLGSGEFPQLMARLCAVMLFVAHGLRVLSARHQCLAPFPHTSYQLSERALILESTEQRQEVTR
jgi:hypothetical protein